MNRLRALPAALIMLGLLACDEQAPRSSQTAAVSQALPQIQTVQAIEQLQQQLQINPNDFAALSRLGDLYFESRQYALAIGAYDEALRVNPRCADCLNDKGLAQFYLGNIDAAVASLDQATTVDPAYPNAWLSKGYVLFSAGRYREAVAPLRQVSQVASAGTLTAEANRFLALIDQRLNP
jgi:tetratricopeptide (TPR) repeat protein